MAIDINIPSQVRDYVNLAAFPVTGSLKTIYIANDTNKTYRWDGSAYVEISASSTGITIGTTAITSGTVGRVLFQGTGNVVQQSSSLFWDSTNNRLGIGTSSPLWGLHYNVDGGLNVGMFSSYGTTSTFESLLYLFRSRGTSSAPSAVLSGDNLGSLRFAGQWGSSLNEYTTGAKIEAVATQNFSSSVNSARMSFYTTADGSIAIRENMRLFSSGNLLLQNGGTFTDAGFRLDVNGTARVQGNTTVQSLLVPTTNLYDIGTLSLRFRDGYFKGILIATEIYAEQFRFAATNYQIRNVGGTQIAQWFGTGNLLIQNGGTFTDAGFKLDVNGTARVQNGLTLTNFTNITSGNNYFGFETFRTIFGTTANTISGQYAFNIDDGGGSSTLTSGTTGRFQLSSRFAPTSGTAVYNSFLLNATINQTGGANGITRGLYINPTLTSASDFRAIETTNGKVIFGNLPTSPAGLPTGAIYNNLGVLMIV